MNQREQGIAPLPEYDRAEPFAAAFMEHEGEHPYIQMTKAHCASWKHSAAHIGQTELLVGVPRPRRVVGSTIYAGLTFDFALYDALVHNGADSAALRQIRDYFADGHITNELIHQKKELEGVGLDFSIGCGPGFQGHMVIDYKKLLCKGVSGLRAEIEAAMEGENKAPNNRPFYESLLLLCDNITDLCLKYAEKARELAAVATGGRSAELAETARICRKISLFAPEGFAEALQLYWFAFLLDNSDDAGRLDCILHRFYESDIEKGLITRPQAKVLFVDLWYKMRQTSTWGVVLGGQTEDGADASNELTYLCLEVTAELRLTNPAVSLRVSEKTPDRLWRAAMGCISSGGGMPALINDPAVIGAFLADGIPEVHARDYAVGGCIEYQISGKSNFGGEDGGINLAKCLELALNDGVCALTGRRLGPSTGDPATFESFEQFYGAYKKQAEWAAGRIMRGCNIGQEIKSQQGAKIFRSLLLDDCIKRGLDCEGGGALYGNGQILTNGIIVVADSLCALKYLVFEQKAMTIAQLLEALKDNWAGHEEMRLQIASRAPRFGNHDVRADQMAAGVAGHIFAFFKRHKTYRGGHYTGLVVYFSRQKIYGELTGATPDGRRAGDVLEDSIGPWPGRDTNGPTAMLSSAAGIPQTLAAGGVVLNLKLAPYNFSSDEQTEKSIALVKSYFGMGGQHVQITVADADDLKQAMLEPEKYRHLIVRVGGYADYFTRLDRTLQESILLRAEY